MRYTVYPKLAPASRYGSERKNRCALTITVNGTLFVCEGFVSQNSMWNRGDYFLYLKQEQYELWEECPTTFMLAQDVGNLYYYFYEETYFLLQRGVLI